MAANSTQRRRKLYSKLSSQIALLSNARLQELLEQPETSNGWGRTQTLEIGHAKVFLKRIPVTALEYVNLFSTKNLYGLPMYYHYGVGSAGFGVFRELVTHIKTTTWVLEGVSASFPLMYHYRILPTRGVRAEIDHERHQNYVDYWGGDVNISRYFLDRAAADQELILFLEYIPYTVGNWLPENPQKAGNLLAEMRDAISLMQQNGILHFDAHFHNMLTDGKSFYLTDFGLALDKEFELTSEEAAFYRRHAEYDYGELLSCYGSHLCRQHRKKLPQTEQDAISEEEFLSRVLSADTNGAKYGEAIRVMNHFFSTLRNNHKKDTRFPSAKLRRLLTNVEFLPIPKAKAARVLD